MNAAYSIAVMVAFFLAGVVVFELLGRVWERWAPRRVKRVADTMLFYYLYPFRWATPDVVYKLWLRTGIMSPDAYREFQGYNFIRDDLDPEHIQRYETSDETVTVDEK